MKFFLFFIFLLCINIIEGYKPGEIINLNYTNITSVNYPCIFYNKTAVYISGDVDIGDVECSVTYYNQTDIINDNVISSGGSGSISGNAGGRYVLSPKKPINTTCKNCSTITTNTTNYTNVPKLITDETAVQQTIGEENNINKTTQNNTVHKISGITILIISVIIIVLIISGIFLFKKRESNPEQKLQDIINKLK